jgi:acid stress-induced BolA-like protein IbaG/YrbA
MKPVENQPRQCTIHPQITILEINMSPEDVKKLIEDGVEGAQAIISGEGCNLECTVISDAFEGKTMLAEQKMVYATVNHLIQTGELHALGIKAFTKSEWAGQQA